MKHQAIPVGSQELRPFAEQIAQARAGYESGHGVDHAVVSVWLRTWGDTDYKPFAEWLYDWNG